MIDDTGIGDEEVKLGHTVSGQNEAITKILPYIQLRYHSDLKERDWSKCELEYYILD